MKTEGHFSSKGRSSRFRIAGNFSFPALLLGILLSVCLTFMLYRSIEKSEKEQASSIGTSVMHAYETQIGYYTKLPDLLSWYSVDNPEEILEHFGYYALNMYQRYTALKSVQFYTYGGERYAYPDNTFVGLDSMFTEEQIQAAVDPKSFTYSDVISLPGDRHGIALLTPIYLKSDRWVPYGYSVIVVSLEEIAKEINFDILNSSGYSYQIFMADPEGTEYTLKQQGTIQPNAVRLAFSDETNVVIGCYLSPKRWVSWYVIGISLFLLFTISFEFAIHIRFFNQIKSLNTDLESRNTELNELAYRDQLTGLFNRRGADLRVEALLDNPETQSAAMLGLDIDKFKSINDTYGHEVGDVALKALASLMKETFGPDPIYMRNGGDEFNILIPNPDEAAMVEKLNHFTRDLHVFRHGSQTIYYSISCGYVMYPEQAKTFANLYRRADRALYHVKTHGRQNWAKYQSHSFDLDDFSKEMPGAMLIYRADESSKIIFASEGLVDLFECDSMEQFMAYTKESFCHIVHPEDLARVEAETNQQILESGEKQIDHVEYRIITAKQNVRLVEDYGRLVDSPKYGKVYYVYIAPKPTHSTM